LKEPLPLLLVGAGAMSRLVAEQAAKRPRDLRVCGVMDVDGKRAHELAAACSTVAYTNLSKAIRELPPAASYVASPHGAHYAQCRDLLKARWHVLLEKPMTTRAVDAAKLVALARRKHRVLGLCHPARYRPEIRHLAKLTKNLGGPVSGTLVNYRDYFTPGRKGWWLDPKLAGGGILRNLGNHRIDLLSSVFGMMPRRVLADVVSLGHAERIDSGYSMWLDFGDGVTATVHQVGHVHGIKGSANSLDVCCRRGAIKLTGDNRMLVARGGREFRGVKVPGRPAEAPLLRDFACAVRGLANTLPDMSYGAWINATIDAAYRSSRLGRLVTIQMPKAP